MQSSELIDLTRPAAVTELLKEARCLRCQSQDRRCLVEQYSGHCLQCQSSESCVFKRSITKVGTASAFSWEQLTGQPEVPAPRQPVANTLGPIDSNVVEQPAFAPLPVASGRSFNDHLQHQNAHSRLAQHRGPSQDLQSLIPQKRGRDSQLM